MKRLAVILFVAGLMVSSLAAPATKADSGPTERAVVEFTQTVKLLNVLLRGEYLIVHDDAKMAQGEPCLYIYRNGSDGSNQPVVSFHCRPVVKNKVDKVTIVVSTTRTPFDLPEVREIQFPGIAKAHQIP